MLRSGRGGQLPVKLVPPVVLTTQAGDQSIECCRRRARVRRNQRLDDLIETFVATTIKTAVSVSAIGAREQAPLEARQRCAWSRRCGGSRQKDWDWVTPSQLHLVLLRAIRYKPLTPRTSSNDSPPSESGSDGAPVVLLSATNHRHNRPVCSGRSSACAASEVVGKSAEWFRRPRMYCNFGRNPD